MQSINIKLILTLFFVLMFNPFSFAQSIEGTYVLESRIFPDGTVIKSPEIMGVYNLEAGYINFNLAYKDSSGKIQSVSFIGQ